MIQTKKLISIMIVLVICCSMFVGCGKVDLQTEEAAIAYLKDYVIENSKWNDIADELGVSIFGKDDMHFHDTSTAQMRNGNWEVILHGHLNGYGRERQHEFSYAATITADGQISDIEIFAGILTRTYR